MQPPAYESPPSAQQYAASIRDIEIKVKKFLTYIY